MSSVTSKIRIYRRTSSFHGMMCVYFHCTKYMVHFSRPILYSYIVLNCCSFIHRIRARITLFAYFITFVECMCVCVSETSYGIIFFTNRMLYAKYAPLLDIANILNYIDSIIHCISNENLKSIKVQSCDGLCAFLAPF